MITVEQMEKLSYLDKKTQVKLLKDFCVYMMDLTEQTESEDIYIELHKSLEVVE